jgi:hypothetical protein
LPDGRIVVATGMTGLFGTRGATLSIVGDGGDLTTLASTDGWIWQPHVSPDGYRVAYVDTDSVRVVDLETGEVMTITGGMSVDWLDDERLLVLPVG